MNEQTKIVNNVMMYMYNASPYDIYEAVYGDWHSECYIREKVQKMSDFGTFWSELDEPHRERLVQAAMNRYAK
jgi:hypothetical protein